MAAADWSGRVWYSSRSGRRWARLAAALSAVCVLAHVRMAWDGAVLGSVPLVMASLGLAVACSPCAVGLWRTPAAGEWRLTALMAAAMLALHAPLMSFPGHVHTGTAPGSLAAAALLVLTSGVIATQGLRRTSRSPAQLPAR
ncbi:hypothetical protein [Cryptosporangium sp. NPDC048952]|uniref:hypothetical protein n=1 Tax=Cryptosporangium sp. NPDC048952 TaxID=3363961 RepID=UPI003719FCC4